MVQLRALFADEIDTRLFCRFERRQVVKYCIVKQGDRFVKKYRPFVDDWTEDDYKKLTVCLKSTAGSGGLVCGAFVKGWLKGFVSVEAEPFGSKKQYMDLSNIYVSTDVRGAGIGRKLFDRAKSFARHKNAQKLYISAHSAVESQAFYMAMGCCEAAEYDLGHVKKEPCDIQLECIL